MKKRSKKILNLIVDIILFTITISITDQLMLKVIKYESFWLELVIYIVLYCIVFGAKSGIIYLWNRRRKNYEENK